MILIAISVGAAVACFITVVKRLCNNYLRRHYFKNGCFSARSGRVT